MTEYAANLAASLRAGARLGPDEAARAVLPLADELVAEHARGQVRGSLDPAYVPPEVSAGRPPSTASDVWSVGALLFHAMAGHHPFEHSPETPARLRRAGRLGPIVEAALAEDPTARPTMAEFAATLRSRGAGPATSGALAGTPSASTAPAEYAGPITAQHREAGGPVGGVGPRRTTLLAVILAALVVTLALVAAVLVLGRHHSDGPVATPPAGSSPTASASSTAASSPTARRTKKKHHKHRARKRPSAGEMNTFARRYVATASRDPSEGFRMLTSGYRKDSPRYRQFWSSVRGARILHSHADPKAMTVTYTYRYTLPAAKGSRTSHTETVTLDLVRHGKRLLVAGAS